MIIKPFEMIKTMGMSKVPNHEKHISVIIEPSHGDRQGNEVYKVPGYDILRAESK